MRISNTFYSLAGVRPPISRFYVSKEQLNSILAKRDIEAIANEIKIASAELIIKKRTQDFIRNVGIGIWNAIAGVIILVAVFLSPDISNLVAAVVYSLIVGLIFTALEWSSIKEDNPAGGLHIWLKTIVFLVFRTVEFAIATLAVAVIIAYFNPLEINSHSSITQIYDIADNVSRKISTPLLGNECLKPVRFLISGVVLYFATSIIRILRDFAVSRITKASR